MRATLLESGIETETGIHGKNVGDLCRKLVEQGVTEGGLEIYRGDMKCLIVKSIAIGAEQTVLEEPTTRHGKFNKFVNFIDKTQEVKTEGEAR